MASATRLGGAIGLFAICSCANQGAPPGGPRDLTGPQVVETFPDTFEVLAAFDDEIRIVFDERISESGIQGTLDGAVIVSPQSGEVSVRHSSRELRVTMAGGFQPDQVYRVTVEPVVQDLFRNEMVGAFEFIFSTGAEMTPTVLAGSVIDRLTELPVRGARVTARVELPPGVERSDGVQGLDGVERLDGAESLDDLMVPTHVATTDSSGVYAFRYVPAGRYEMTAFEDQNRNRERDDLEPMAVGREELNPADTVLLNFSLLVPDTTPAMIQRVDVVDSLTLAVEFDDFFDPALELTGVSASLGPDSLSPPEVVTILHERDYLSRRDVIQDSLYAFDSIQFEDEQQRIESLRSAGDSTAAQELESELSVPRPPAQSSPQELRTRQLPKSTLYVLLADTLVTDRPYELSVEGVTNINGVPDGGGTAEVLREAPP